MVPIPPNSLLFLSTSSKTIPKELLIKNWQRRFREVVRPVSADTVLTYRSAEIATADVTEAALALQAEIDGISQNWHSSLPIFSVILSHQYWAWKSCKVIVVGLLLPITKWELILTLSTQFTRGIVYVNSVIEKKSKPEYHDCILCWKEHTT